ncbi:MAG: right-handed parallel beta-helix repeat-containing protein, partial [Planctomycetota bacterium]
MTSFTWFGSLRDAVGQKPRKRMLARTRWPRHLSVEALEARHLPATFTVMNTFDSGPDSLRQAITDANNQANLGGPDIIRFEIPGAGVHRIWPTTILPQIKDPVVIDGYTQSGSSRNTSAMGDNAVLLIELDGGLGPSTASGLVITATASGSTVSGLIIGGFGARGDSNNGIDIQSSNNLITGNFIGTNAPNGGNGIKVEFGASNNTIGGDLASERNVISGNDGSGIEITGPSANNNVVAGNYIGTDASGIHLVRNKGAAGILLQDGASNNIIGGSDPASGNLISGNSNNGIEILGARTNPANHTMKNWVAGNLIGTDITGGSGLG